jgi:transposase
LFFEDRRGNRLKILWYSSDGMNLLSKRLDGGKFVWPQTATGTAALTSEELSMLLEGIDLETSEAHDAGSDRSGSHRADARGVKRIEGTNTNKTRFKNN